MVIYAFVHSLAYNLGYYSNLTLNGCMKFINSYDNVDRWSKKLLILDARVTQYTTDINIVIFVATVRLDRIIYNNDYNNSYHDFTTKIKPTNLKPS